MPSNTIQPNVPGLDKGLAAGQRLTASKGVFASTLAAGGTIATLNDPFGSGSTFATVGTVPAQLQLSGATIVKGSGAVTVGAEYNIKVMATSADGQRETSTVLTFGVVLPLGGTPPAGGGGSIFPLAKGLQVLCDGDSISAQNDSRSLAGHLNAVAAGRLNFQALASNAVPGSVGAGGRTAAQQFSLTPGIISANPNAGMVVLHIGTNSVNGTPNFAQIIADITATIDLYNNANKHVVFSCILPKNGDAALDQGRKDVNAAIAALTGKKLTVVNHDSTHPLSDLTWQGTDGLPHPNVVGVRRMAQNIVNAMSFVAASVNEELTTNILANPTFTGTGGLVASGFPNGTTAPDNWRLQNDSGATMTASIVIENGVRKMQIDVSGTANAGGVFWFGQSNTATLALLTGEWLEGKMDVEITGPGGVGDPVGLNAWQVSFGNSIIFDAASGSSTYGTMSQAFNGPARVQPRKAAADAAANTGQFRSAWLAGTVGARIKISQPVAQKRSA